MALGSARSMVTHKGSVLAQMYFTTAFLSLCHGLPAQAKPMALGAAPASGSSAAETGQGKNTHHCQTVGQSCQTPLEMLPYPVASSCMCNFLWLPYDKLVPIRSPHIRNRLQWKHIYKHYQLHISQVWTQHNSHDFSSFFNLFHFPAQQFPHSLETQAWVTISLSTVRQDLPSCFAVAQAN